MMNNPTAAPLSRRWQALWRHLWLDEKDARRWIGAAGLERLARRVQEGERAHGAEIRICVEAALPIRRLLHRCSPRARAIELFGRLGVGRTSNHRGVLLYVLLADRAIELVLDPVLHATVPAERWASVVQAAGPALMAGQPEQGLNAALEALNAVLGLYAASAPDIVPDRNELPDDLLVI